MNKDLQLNNPDIARDIMYGSTLWYFRLWLIDNQEDGTTRGYYSFTNVNYPMPGIMSVWRLENKKLYYNAGNELLENNSSFWHLWPNDREKKIIIDLINGIIADKILLE